MKIAAKIISVILVIALVACSHARNGSDTNRPLLVLHSFVGGRAKRDQYVYTRARVKSPSRKTPLTKTSQKGVLPEHVSAVQIPLTLGLVQ